MVSFGDNGCLSKRITDELSRLILETGEFGPGQKIPNENELSERFGVSRSTLREAIKTLAAREILEVRRGKGTFVAETLPEKGGPSLLELNKMKIELRDLYEVRLIFEPQVAALACRRATEDELQQIEDLQSEVERLMLSGKDATEADINFHTAILHAAHNDFLFQIAPVVERALSDRRFLNAGEHILASAVPDHAAIMEFLRKRDTRGTESAVSMHLHRLVDVLSY